MNESEHTIPSVAAAAALPSVDPTPQLKTDESWASGQRKRYLASLDQADPRV